MSFLNNKDGTDKWKEKYFNLLDEQQQAEQISQQREQLLCKTIIRLSLAAKGFQKQLDPYLNRIRKQLKQGLNSEKLKAELEEFSNALIRLEDGDNAEEIQPDVTLLFDFLSRQFSDVNIKSSLQLLQSRYEANGFHTPQDLFTAIIEATQADNTGQLPESAFAIDQFSTHQIDTEIVSRQLLQLLENVEIPSEFDTQAESLKKQLKTSVAKPSFNDVLDKSVTLLLNIKKHIQSEQQEIEDFLSNITEQLTDLGNKAIGAGQATHESGLSRNEFDNSVTEQMQALKLSSAKATKLEPLKHMINGQLEEITLQIQDYKDKVSERNLEGQLQEMTARISKMELESSELKSKLKVAHDKALRDPLTGLPNRLAYDERLAAEYARWKRYQSPLSLLIWDIDHFKHINDKFGHKSGDKTLILITGLLTSNCRKTDFVARFGGEEFIMLLPDTNKESALKAANHIRQIIEKTAFNASGKSITITVSCGISDFSDNDTHDSVFNRADHALYQAKQQGRNLCIVG